ncbi:MAG: methenyltetrahydrofolate cyclohydrolase [Thermoleophilaceae bacterium]|jgi:formiminotetrahydrofolate cyclodeaminase|nr:methenyltetrahydrofolate cyclohydrolase [Thermoleophilaceae bacterium]
MSGGAIDLSVRDFSAQLAAKQPTPGGGSAAALAGALGAGLVSMVCNYTVGRDKFADVEYELQGVLARSEALRAELEQAVEDDIAAYGGYGQASALPKDTEEQQRARAEALQAALRDSTSVPLAVAERCAELLELAVQAAELGNPFLISDAAVGAELAAAALNSAALNVRLNVGGIEDEAFRVAAQERLDAVAARASGGDLVVRATAIVADRTP